MSEMNPTINGTCRCSLLSAIDLLDSPLTLALFFFLLLFSGTLFYLMLNPLVENVCYKPAYHFSSKVFNIVWYIELLKGGKKKGKRKNVYSGSKKKKNQSCH